MDIKKRIFLTGNVFIFIIIALSVIGSAETLYVREVGSDYTSIQSAVDNASSGDTIIVSPGIYNENINITVDNLVIKSISKNPDDTVVRTLSSSDDVFSVNANKVTIEGFSIVGIYDYEIRDPYRTYPRNYSGINLISCMNCHISNNKLSNTNGILLNNTDFSILDHNTFIHNRQCISLFSSSSNILINNQASENEWSIGLSSSNNNTLINNTINCITGIGLGYSDNNIIANNNFHGSGGLTLHNSNHNTLTNNKMNSYTDKIRLFYSDNNTLTNNTASDSTFYLLCSNNNTIFNNSINSKDGDGTGISIIEGNGNLLTNNKVINNCEGILLANSNSNTLADNTISSNRDFGIRLVYSSSNILINNTASLNNDSGIFLLPLSNSNKLINNTANLNKNYGIFLVGSSDNEIISNIASSNNNSGICLIPSTIDRIYTNNNMLINNTVNSNNCYGIFLDSSSKNMIVNNTANLNKNSGIYLKRAHINLIFKNYFNNTNNSKIEDSIGNTWNTTEKIEKNIMSNSYIGGNYWATPSGNGFSQIHSDANGDGICDIPYNLNGSDFDYLPLASIQPEPYNQNVGRRYTELEFERQPEKEDSVIISAPLAYITNSRSSTISVIDTATNTVKTTLPFRDTPKNIVTSADGTKVYVLGWHTLSVINTSTNTVATTNVAVYNWPIKVAVTPDGKKAYVTSGSNSAFGSDTVYVLDTATTNVTATVKVGKGPEGVAVTPDGKKVYVANWGFTDQDFILRPGDTVSVIDTATNTVTATVNVGKYPNDIAVSPDGKKVYVTNGGFLNYIGNYVSIIDTSTDTFTSSVCVGKNPVGIAISPDGKKVYVANSKDNTVSVIDTTTNILMPPHVIATVKVGITPTGVAVTPDGKKVYVTCIDTNGVSVIDTATNTLTTTVKVGDRPYGIAIGKFMDTMSNNPDQSPKTNGEDTEIPSTIPSGFNYLILAAMILLYAWKKST